MLEVVNASPILPYGGPDLDRKRSGYHTETCRTRTEGQMKNHAQYKVRVERAADKFARYVEQQQLQQQEKARQEEPEYVRLQLLRQPRT